MRGPQFSGALFRNILEELEGVVGHDSVWSAAADLDAEQRGECLDVLAIRWVHASTSVALVRATATRVGRDARQLHDLVVRRASERAYTTIWRVIFNLAMTPEAMITRVPLVFQRIYRGLRAEATLEGRGRGLFRLRDWPGIDELSLHGIAVGADVALRLCSKHEIAITPERTPDGARYLVRWSD